MVSGGDTDLWTWAGIFTCHIHKPVVEYAFTQHRPDMKKAELFLIQHIYNLTFGTENNYFILLRWNGLSRRTQAYRWTERHRVVPVECDYLARRWGRDKITKKPRILGVWLGPVPRIVSFVFCPRYYALFKLLLQLNSLFSSFLVI